MATPDLSKMSVRSLCRNISAQTEYLCEVGEEADRADIDDARAEVESVIAELERRMTPPPGCVRIGDADFEICSDDTSHTGYRTIVVCPREAAEAARASTTDGKGKA